MPDDDGAFKKWVSKACPLPICMFAVFLTVEDDGSVE